MKNENRKDTDNIIYKSQEEVKTVLDSLHIDDKDVPDYSRYEDLPFDDYCRMTGYRPLEKIIEEYGCEKEDHIEYDFNEWYYTKIYDVEEIKKRLGAMKLVGRTISDIRFVSFVYDLSEDVLAEHLHYVRERYFNHDLDRFFELADIDETFPYPLYIQMDEPVLIRFEDGEQFEIDTVVEGCFTVNMNSIPWNAETKKSGENVNPMILLDFCIGAKVVDVAVRKSKWTDSEGTECEEIDAVIISLLKEDDTYNLVFESDCHDYMMLTVENSEGYVIHVPFKKLLKSMYRTRGLEGK